MTHHDKDHAPRAMADIRNDAAIIAGELRAAAANTPNEPPPATGGGSRHRQLPEDLRQKVVALRDELYRRGVFDPVLALFDTAAAPQISTLAIADQLEQISAAS